MSSPLDRVANSVARRYTGDRRLLTFEALLEQFVRDPYPLVRNAVQYLRDAVLTKGTREVVEVGRTTTRYVLFDGAADEGVPALVGHEQAGQEVVEAIVAAAREGRLDRMIVLHGPNGSGKSSLVELLLWGLEEYSHTPAGAMYALRWVFPRTPAESAGLGFAGHRGGDEPDSYALLEAEDVAARIVCELRCNPLYVIPDSERPALVESALEVAPERRRESFRHYLAGNLCPRCKNVYEALLAAYRGDWRRVVRHVQVERVFVSRRYRGGAVVTQPQGTADAQMRIVSGDVLVSGLPPHLRAVPLFEVLGDLADANRGLLEFSDFLKRNLELSKYLLQTTEKGLVTVGNRLLELDVVFAATVNERHLEEFAKYAEFPSFHARMTFVRVPYLVNMTHEIGIYRAAVGEMARTRHVAPHLAEFTALFAVLTRLEMPRKEHFSSEDWQVIGGLTPVEKARLYAEGAVPARLDATAARELRRLVPALRDEFRRANRYEGRVGASVREMRALLGQAAARDATPCLAPSALLDELREMIADTSRHRFLQVESNGDYHDVPELLKAATAELVAWIVRDVEDALELVADDEYDRRFAAYFLHVVAAVKQGTVHDASTGRRTPPDEVLMQSVEEQAGIAGDPGEHRKDLVARIGAYAVDHPDEQPLDFRRLFPDLHRSLRARYFDDRRAVVDRVRRNVLAHGTPGMSDLPEADRRLAERAIANLTSAERDEDSRYCACCLKDAVALTLREEDGRR